MKLKELNICEDDFQLFVELSPKEKIQFLFDASQLGIEQAVTKQVSKIEQMIHDDEPRLTSKIIVQDIMVGMHRLSILSMEGEVHINSDSLSVLRKFVRKLWNDGYMLSKLDSKKTEFDFYRYYKAYKIIGKAEPFSCN